MSEASAESFDDVQMSREGMRLLLCNDWLSAESLFDKYKYVSFAERTIGQKIGVDIQKTLCMLVI